MPFPHTGFNSFGLYTEMALLDCVTVIFLVFKKKKNIFFSKMAAFFFLGAKFSADMSV